MRGTFINKCRVCKSVFFNNPLLVYQNMPAGAQSLPSKNELKRDIGVDLKVYQCSGCGLVQLSNKPVPYYKQVIRASAFSEEMQNFRELQFKKFVEKYSLNNKKIVEVGCGQGEYLTIMKKYCPKTYGLEYSKSSVKKCINNGLDVSYGFVTNNFKIKDAPFDAFFIFNFLEHLPNINSVLRGILKNLTDSGVGIIEVPNFDMILKNNLFSEFIIDHLFYFTKDTLETALKLNGLEIVESNVIWHDYIISVVVKKRNKLSLDYFYNNQKKLSVEVNKYIDQFKKNEVAIWGAGHQALTIISMLHLENKIKYVIDSAVFKQDKYTPVTHIPIVAPEMLVLDPIKAVIVMAASYSDEVVKTIRSKFDKVINITILRNSRLEKI